MKKIALTMTAFTIIAGGLTGCGAGDENANEGATPTRYAGFEEDMNRGYSNVNNNNRNYRGEGPLTDMMTVDDRNQNRANHQRPRINNNTGTLNDQRQIGNGSGMEENEGNHGMVGDRTGNNGGTQGQMGNNGTANGTQDMDLTRKIVNQVEDVEGVDDASVIVRDNDVLIGIDTTGEENGDTNNLTQKVEKKVQKALNDENKEIHVTTDEEQFGNIQQIGNDLQNGTGLNEVGDTIDSMIEDLSNAAQQPFQDS